MVFWIIVGAICLVLACVNQRSLWRGTTAWRYRNPDAAEPSDARYAVSRVGWVLLGLFLIIMPIVVTQSNKHDAKAQAQASASASSVEAQAEQSAEAQLSQDQDASQGEAIAVMETIAEHTPKGKSPRTVALSKLHTWMPEIGSSYTVTPESDYSKTGRVTIDQASDESGGLGAACLIVPTKVPTTAQITSGNMIIEGNCYGL